MSLYEFMKNELLQIGWCVLKGSCDQRIWEMSLPLLHFTRLQHFELYFWNFMIFFQIIEAILRTSELILRLVVLT